ncbi:HK97 gp10 family phage protein [Biostraticola tofi]|uniref:HK97 gp10 family phage protein n=1 Tax=Biostraticola tofi TaxID=466109 RepID=A0A4R3Z8I4_9GAMM|nr:HK97 gp10 family phage protein [Biostraticola tofi]TCW00390.1 hypothetical protein EDC52_101740 [Biostraticola tofi]
MARVRVTGIRQAQSNLDSLVGDIRGRKVVRALHVAMLIGGAHASLLTPIDTSTLINSQFREVTINGTRITGRVGYSANYAVYVHGPNHKQTFRRSTATKEFLTKGFDEELRQIDAAVARELSL